MRVLYHALYFVPVDKTSVPSSSSLEDQCQLVQIIETLESLVKDVTKLSDLPEETYRRLLTAAGILARPGRTERRKQLRAISRQNRERNKCLNAQKRDRTVIRKLRSASVFVAPTEVQRQNSSTEGPGHLEGEQKCYGCKETYTKIHFFYDQLCESCSKLNYSKRFQTANLTGRVALVTGGRIKIGYQTVLKLLQSGARVITTTRFPRDAALRFSKEDGFETWSDRLEIYGVDFRHTPSVESFAEFLSSHLSQLDFIVHNACQTIRRPSGFYKHLLAFETAPLNALTNEMRAVLGSFSEPTGAFSFLPMLTGQDKFSLSTKPLIAAELTQLPLTKEDLECGSADFPEGKLDADQQQVDLRDRNSWMYALEDVPTVELIEVHLVNAVAPFVLNAKLKSLMNRQSTKDKHIVNVSAMEGQFYRKIKTHRHPHTNMAKAALNMMTRTSAQDYATDGIHMNSVDTGWVSEECPTSIAEKKRTKYDFHPPLDIVDGASRILDPIFDGFNTGQHHYGCFFKNYKPTLW